MPNLDRIFFEIDDIQKQSEINSRKKYLVDKYKTLSFEDKEKMAIARIQEFFKYCKLNKLPDPVISFSGGKDSCVLRHMVRKIKKNTTCIISAELFNPDNAKIIRDEKNKEIFKAIKTFDEVIKDGYPMISKEISQKINSVRNCKKLGNWVKASLGLRKSRKIANKYLHLLDKEFVKYELTHMCCSYIKGAVKHDKRPKFIGTTIHESQLRRTNWIQRGCNIYDSKTPMSRPISLFTDKDVFQYAKKHKLKLSEAYNKGWARTGCMLCGFGLQFECSIRDKLLMEQKKDKNVKVISNRLELLKKYYPNVYNNYIWKKEMYKPLIDTYVTIINDKKYMKEYAKRHEEIKEWYKNKELKIKKIIKQIETQTNSRFTNLEKEKIFTIYGGKNV